MTGEGKRSLTYVEVDIDYCANTYGIAPCTAAVGVTGTDKCFNSLNTCQDRVHFINDPVTIRFALDCDYLPTDIPAIPSIGGVSFSPATISLGKDLGQRATLNVKFRDHPHSDTGPGFDKYYAERDYNPFEQGSFWGKWRARQPFLKGRAIRLIRGFVGQTLAEMDTRHYIIESFDGPTPAGEYSLVGKDVLKLADGDRAQAPAVSNGFLVAGISAVALSATLSPSGIGAAEYPASGYVAIGGSEIMSFTRVGDVLTIVRAQLGTTAAAHDVQDRVQLCLQYVGQDPADIIYDLFTTYAFVPASYIVLNDWQNETGSFLQRLYGATIADPTDVNTLVSELIEQAALAIWWDDVNQKINLKVLRAISVDAFTFDDENTLQGSLQVTEQPNLRASQIWTYYGQRNPLRPIDEPDNFRSTLATVNLQAETDEGQAAILKIFSRWIPAFGRDTAERLNDIQLGRFQVPPRRFTFEVFRDSVDDPVLGGGYQVGNWSIQDAFGARALAPIQITRLNGVAEKFTVEAEEMLFEALDPADLIDRTIIIDSNINNVNLRTIHDGIFPVPVAFESPSITVTCIIESAVIVGSVDTATPSFDVGTWPGGVSIHIVNNGEIRGAGGAGGIGGNSTGSNAGSPLDGFPGGTALYTRYPITYEDAGAITYGGGGGGGGGSRRGGGGGGGAGVVPGAGGDISTSTDNPQPGDPGTQDAGGLGGDGGGSNDLDGGDGGTPGVVGFGGQQIPGFPGGDGGAAGAAIDGISFVTQVGAVGSRLGGQVN